MMKARNGRWEASSFLLSVTSPITCKRLQKRTSDEDDDAVQK